MIRRLINTLESGEVLRYHAAPGVTKQTDAHHAWGVAVLALHIVGYYEINKNLLVECLLHDSGELVTGDIPFTAKRHNPELGRQLNEFEATARKEDMMGTVLLSEREHGILKICDTLEGLIWCFKEENAKTGRGFHRGQVYLRWCGAYVHAREKFNDFLSEEEWKRADAIFTEHDGCFPAGFLANLTESIHV